MSELALQLIAENKKTKAKTLDLGNCGLTEVPEEALECVWIEELVLSYNWLEYYPDTNQIDIKYSQNKGSQNVIQFLPTDCYRWKQLKKLIIDSTNISDLRPLEKLVNLVELNCYDTQISDLTPLQNLVNLQSFDCHNTQVSNLKPLEKLVNLQRLSCSSTQITDLKGIESLVNLQTLSCSSTQVSNLLPLKRFLEDDIPIYWQGVDYFGERGFFVKDCPLDRSLIAAIKSGNDAVLKYLNKPKERLWESRVLVLGEPRAGKTTLRRKLKSANAIMPTDKESTEGI
ncbi:MAG: leucine-rich repeat domain-containing protein [Saprospiraceae bacterium]